MDWNAVAAISAIIQAVVVIVSLGYVAVQLRQNTKAIVANSRQGLLDSEIGLISDYMNHAVDPHLVDDHTKLSREDERRFTWLIVKALRIREAAWHQYKSGTLDEESWRSYMVPVRGIFSTRRAQFVLSFYTGSPEFMRLIREQLDEPDAASPD